MKKIKKIIKQKKKKEKENVDKGFIWKKRLKWIFIIAISIIVLELMVMYLISKSKDNNITYIDTYNSIYKTSDYYILTGSSNYKYSHYNDAFIYEYEDDKIEGQINKVYAEQAKLVKLDKELNVVFEKTFKTEYDSCFYDAIVSNDAIYAVGDYVYNKDQLPLKTRDGLLAKYDLNGNLIWSKNYQVLGDTKFMKILEEKDGLVVVGQSIYENMEIGNHPNGGGIIVKYDFDGNVIWNNNFGGNKSGIFNDIVKVDDGYIVVGKDAVNYGMIVKFTLDGELVKYKNDNNEEKIWLKNYTNTDDIGMTAVKLKDNKLYIAGAYNKSEEKDEDGNTIFEYDACIFVYNLDGELLNKFVIKGNKDDRFNKILLLDNSIIAVGYTGSSDIELPRLNYKEHQSEGMIVEFDYDGKILNKTVYGGSKNDNLNDIIESIPGTDNLINNTKSYIVIGFSNSRRQIFNGNNKDYFGKILKYNSKLELELEK